MSRTTGRALWVVLVALGCVSAVGIACNFSTLNPQGTKLDASEAVNPDTKPIPVSLTLDQSHASSAIIGPEGGTLAATGADGTRYTLEIPAKALVEDVEIGLVPITSMDGIPWKNEGLIGAVQLEPDGQMFYSYVNLTIQPADNAAVDQIVPVGASGPDHDLYMPLVDPNSDALTSQIGPFFICRGNKGTARGHRAMAAAAGGRC